MRSQRIIVPLLGVNISLWACAHGGKGATQSVQASREAQPETPLETGRFHYVGGALTCLAEGKEPAPNSKACLHLADVRLGEQIEVVKQRLGEPYEVNDGTEEGHGATAYVYLIDVEEDPTPRLIFSESGGRVVGIEVMGVSAGTVGLSGVYLGDREDRLVYLLGPPATVAHDDGVDVWRYAPFPMSFSVRDGRVFSMRIGTNGEATH